MNAAQHINQSSGNVEIYTPGNILEAARLTLGAFDLDPASSSAANERVMAARIFTQADDGLSQPWSGRIWMNHPFGKKDKKTGHPGNSAWIDKLESEFVAGNVTAACCICFASTSEKWFRPLLFRPQCFLSPRLNYLLPNGSVYRGVTKGSVVTYFGYSPARFAKAFAALGVVKIYYPS